MKFHGREIAEPNIVYVVLPRNNQPDIIFYCRPVWSREEFDKLCPRPEPPKIIRGRVKESQTDDPGYRKRLRDHDELYWQWLFLASIRDTPGLELELVKADEPATWGRLEEEFRAAKLTDWEVARIQAGVNEANGLSESTVEAARKRFLEGLAAGDGLDPVSAPANE
jgi:hypothetical protein